MQGGGQLNGGIDKIMVRTVLNLSKSTIDYWQNITCLYNPYWFSEQDRVTLPFCFFHVVKYSELSKAETSKKRIIMYSPPTEESGAQKMLDPIGQSAMQTIVDNTVIQPKTYRMELLVPFMPFGRYVRQGVELSSLITETLNMLDVDRITLDNVKQQFRDAYGLEGFATHARYALDMQDTQLQNETMVNKHSLDAMFERGGVLKLKTWMQNTFKYITITDMTAEKRGSEDNYWRVDLTAEERPILSLTPLSGPLNKVDRDLKKIIGAYSKLTGEAL